MFKEYTKVKTLVAKNGFPAGTTGIVVSLYGDGPACDVELLDGNSYPFDVVTYTVDDLEIANDQL